MGLFSFGNRKKSQGNTVVVGPLMRCFWVIMRSQATMCEQAAIMVQKPVLVLPQIRAFLADCFAQITHNLQVTPGPRKEKDFCTALRNNRLEAVLKQYETDAVQKK
ncbi:unnamed protein product [Parnassius apollo]|uniref:(apollo) hypothetical protein n=1 Tax=Parnassius apollo TaxID=110799 RepID=A0A8S3WCX4_PARAO|nr:unnamed protein product [Parnassius apollo]